MMRGSWRWCWPRWSTGQQAGLDRVSPRGPSRPAIARSPAAARYAAEEWRQRLAAARAAPVGLGPGTLVIYDVTTTHPEAIPR